jgi:regulatory protein
VKRSKTLNEEKADPWPAALRILTRRDYSRFELQKRLADKGFDTEKIDATIRRCLELGYLDDARYAKNRATSLMRQGRAVGNRILVDLKQRGVSAETAHRALDEARKECSEDQLLATLLEKRFPDFNYNSAPAKERRRVVHFLQRRGFAISRIMDQLTRKGSEASDEDR